MELGFEPWLQLAATAPVFPDTLSGKLLLGLYCTLAILFLISRRREFQGRKLEHWIVFVIGLGAIFLTSRALVLTYAPNGVRPAYPLPMLSAPPSVSLAALVIVAAISIWFGAGPGLIAGVVMGLARGIFLPQPFNDVFSFGAWGAFAGVMVNQRFRERIFGLLRQPIVAMLFAGFFPLTLQSVNRFFEVPFGITAIESTLETFVTSSAIWAIGGLMVGMVYSLLFVVEAKWRPYQETDAIHIINRSLRARFLMFLIPVIVLGVIGSVVAVTIQAMNLARRQAISQMDRSAAIAADGIAHFYVTGLNLLNTFAADPKILQSETQQQTLKTDLQVVPFFQEFLLTDVQGQITAFVPEHLRDTELTLEEIQLVEEAVQFGMAQTTHMTVLPSNAYRLTFVRPVFGKDNEEPQGALLGRVQLDVNPEMQRVLKALERFHQEGRGFAIDDRDLIIIHHDPETVLRPWNVNLQAEKTTFGGGIVYDDVSQSGVQTLFYVHDVDGAPFRVVMELPLSVVFENSQQISRPLLGVQLLVGSLLFVMIPFLATRITQPLQTLAAATNRIAEGNLDIPVTISGEDEIAQLGRAFEQMRIRLSDRLNDLSLLLRVSQSVSATLNLEEGVPLILQAILEGTQAATARFVLLRNNERWRVFASGKSDATYPGLDRAFAAALVRHREPLVNQTLPEMTEVAGKPLQSIAAFPVRLHNRTVAVLWIGSWEEDIFDEARVQFLNTLASQAAILVENTRLFQAAEGGRQRLAAILASTTDSILVVDHRHRLLLVNPAGQRLLGLDAALYGRPVDDLPLPEPLTQALKAPTDESRTPTSIEIPFTNGRTFYASIASMTAASPEPQSDPSAEIAGRVVVMRDITHFKELDEMKTEFVATVSHDLRAPLTFIRGYSTMLGMVGELNAKQIEYQQRILEGIERMSALIDDLLNLRRIEAGVGIRQEPTRVGLVLVEAVDNMRARAAAKGVSLQLEPADSVSPPKPSDTSRPGSNAVQNEEGISKAYAQRAAVTVLGDRTLLRQAIGNIVDNAIKYTPAGGTISVGMDVNPRAREVLIHVADTGIGIAPEDQVRLFEKFHRIKRRETGDIPGTGLGLALVKSIVERHKGRVWVESEVNRGSTFFVALPLQAED